MKRRRCAVGPDGPKTGGSCRQAACALCCRTEPCHLCGRRGWDAVGEPSAPARVQAALCERPCATARPRDCRACWRWTVEAAVDPGDEAFMSGLPVQSVDRAAGRETTDALLIRQGRVEEPGQRGIIQGVGYGRAGRRRLHSHFGTNQPSRQSCWHVRRCRVRTRTSRLTWCLSDRSGLGASKCA